MRLLTSDRLQARQLGRGNLAGTVSPSGALTVTAGGAGSSAVGQFVSALNPPLNMREVKSHDFWKDKIIYCAVCGGCVCHTCSCPGGPRGPELHPGSMTSHTEKTSKVTETINSIDYATGWTYSVSGTNVDNGGQSLSPSPTTNTVVVNPLGGTEGQVTSQNAGLDMSNQNFKITRPGEAFQFTTTYMGPGMTNQTVIQRETTVTSVTDTTSIFTQ